MLVLTLVVVGNILLAALFSLVAVATDRAVLPALRTPATVPTDTHL